MKKSAIRSCSAAFFCAIFSFGAAVSGQNTKPAAAPAPQGQATPSPVMNLADYGVSIEPDKRLIVMMAALDAAGFDPTPVGAAPSAFRQQLRKDEANLDPDLRRRLHDYVEHTRLREVNGVKPTPADDAARYISLALSLGDTPLLEAPVRSDDLPGELLEVLDFAPLVREFYRRSGIEDRLTAYYKLYQTEGDNMRRSTQEMVHDVLSYLHTQPLTKRYERVVTTAPGTQKKHGAALKITSTREHEREFYVTPDLLAVPGSVNFRGIADEYYVVVPFGADIRSSEAARRAFLQYVFDPLVVKFGKEISQRRDQIKPLLEARLAAGAAVTPDVFLAVGKSLVAASAARMEEIAKINRIDAWARNQIAIAAKAKDPAAARTDVVKSQAALKQAAGDERIEQLAEAYEKGAVLDFYFAEQMAGVEISGFDVASSIPDMLASFDPAKESARLTESADSRKRAMIIRKQIADEVAKLNASAAETGPDAEKHKALYDQLGQVEDLMRLKNYAEAENRLKSMMVDYQQEPRIFFALGQAASLSAQDAFDENLQSERLSRALFNYRSAIQFASPDTDKALISRAHAAIGRILVFTDQPEEAIKEFDAVIALGDAADRGAYRDATTGKQALNKPRQ